MNSELQHEEITAALRAFNQRMDAEQFPNLRAPIIAALEAYRETVLPEVTSVEELDQLPDDSVVLDDAGAVLRKWCEDTWYKTGNEHAYTDSYIGLPARVLHRPGVNNA